MGLQGSPAELRGTTEERVRGWGREEGGGTGPAFEVSHSQPGQKTLPKAGFLPGGVSQDWDPTRRPAVRAPLPPPYLPPEIPPNVTVLCNQTPGRFLK